MDGQGAAPPGLHYLDVFGLLCLPLARLACADALACATYISPHALQFELPAPLLQIIAEELGLLAHEEGGHHHEEGAAEAAEAAAHAALQHEQPMPPPPAAPQQAHHEPPAAAAAAQPGPAQAPQAAPRPRSTLSAEQSRQLYEAEGLPLDDIAVRRGIKASTVVDHLLATAADGRFVSWGRLAAEVGVGQGGGVQLAPAEVAQAIVDVQQEHPGMELSKLPLRAIRERLEADPATAPKVAALLARRGGSDPMLVYAAVKLVLTALQQGVDFGLLTGGGSENWVPF